MAAVCLSPLEVINFGLGVEPEEGGGGGKEKKVSAKEQSPAA